MKLYLESVAIWMLILYASACIFKPFIDENGWGNDRKSITEKSFIEAFTTLTAISCIPIFRFVICVSWFIMATHKKGD